ncbi:putative MFS family arabinose efflux permease [Blastococcus colisei]|uniref:Putative MFS family arabinose efflux permease n=1 Tax=Blastococcus colisei TaxID=1564162 RepID=A0A543PD87_9ACTN|nr:MFS transporter [Blastococcus colisei]TQN42038.1 putative MFS family arabinose efflux permease [Blastococcus colisei]
MSERPRRSSVRATLQALTVSVIGVIPAFLVGALAVQIRADLDVGLGLFGFAVATLFAVSGVLGRPGGRLVQRLGSRKGTVLAAALATVSLATVASAQSAAMLMVALAIGGLANAVAQPSANLGLSRWVTDRRLGLAFGIKQSAIPTATLLGGLAVPGVALVLGWRWAVAAAAALTVLVLLGALVGRGEASPPGTSGVSREPDRGLPRGGLVVLTIGGFFASAASSPTGVFLVDSAVTAGIASGTAGLLFAGCSLLMLTNRVGFGWLADRHPGQSRFLFIAYLLGGGAVGFALMATGGIPVFVVGAVLACGLGWSWPGLFQFAVIRENRAAAASVTGLMQTGLSLGAACGPMLFGVLAQAFSYTAAWSGVAALSLAGACTIVIGRRMVRRARGLPVTTLRRAPRAASM